MNDGISSLANTTRRGFLQGALGASLLRGGTSAKPNILFIMSDEHNPKVAGFSRNGLARTPSLDRLAQRGVVFDGACCNSPLCAPSRLSFTAGKYIHRIGMWNNECWIEDDNVPSLPRVMNAAGYDSVLCGKQHYDASRRYGFTEIGGNMNRFYQTGVGKRRDPNDTSINRKEAAERFGSCRTGDRSRILDHDRAVTKGVLEFLSRRTASDRPFFLFAGYLAPHFPLTVPPAYYAHAKGRIPLPEIPAGHLDHLPLNYQHLRRDFGTIDVPDSVTMKGRECYYGLTEWVDSEIGRLLSFLDKSRFTDNTVVIYASDHGENMGEHGMWWKNCMYENASRVPLIVSWPKRWKGNQVRSGSCSLLDVATTVAGIGGARVPSDWNGDSLLPWLDDPSHTWKDLSVSQYYAHGIASGYAMLRTGEWKYVYHSAPGRGWKAERELYHLTEDPKEFRNLAGDPTQQGRIEDLHRRLIRELGEDPDESEQRARHDLAKGYGRPPAPADAGTISG
jgi:choline-sulfatase